jgi:hypothetical protein
VKYIKLSRGASTIVDDEDYKEASKYTWCAQTAYGGKLYAARYARVGGKPKYQYLHRMIMQADVGQYVDHINGDTLDNRRQNLRICTNAQNGQNSKKHRDGSSKYKGVSWNKDIRKWSATICCNYKREIVGYFAKEIQAAEAYNRRAIELHGPFARLNQIERKVTA